MANFYCNFHCIITLKQIFPIFLALSFRFTQIIQLKKFVNGLTHKNFSLEKYSRCGRNRYHNCIFLSRNSSFWINYIPLWNAFTYNIITT